jgi:ParB family chromosome partitioning protein
MKLDAIRSQGKRRDLTSVQVEQKLNGKTLREQIAEDMGTRAVQVSRFIRLTELIPKLLDMVDEKRLALSVAVEIYYFNKTYQQWIWEYIHENGMIKQEQLMDLRQYRDDDSLTQEQMIDILIQKRSTPQTRKKILITERKLNKYFPAYYSQSEIERVIVSLLEQWKASQESEEQ